MARLNLVNLVQKIVNEACGLLGMECPEEMQKNLQHDAEQLQILTPNNHVVNFAFYITGSRDLLLLEKCIKVYICRAITKKKYIDIDYYVNQY